MRRITVSYIVLFIQACLLSFSALAEDKGYIFGVHPFASATKLEKKFSPLVDYLSTQLGTTVKLEISKDYAAHIDAIGQDRFDIAYAGPASYVKMTDKYGLKPFLARSENDGKATFKGAILVSKHSKIQTLADLKGKHFAFGSPSSTMSHLVPRYMLLEAGITGSDLGSFEFLGNHDQVASSVLLGDFDAGAVKSSVFKKYEPKGLRLLAWTPPISTHMFVAGKQVPEAEIANIREALLAVNTSPDKEKVLKPIKKSLTGFVPGTDADYDNLRNILNELKKRGIMQ